jgi:hypothetical protein
MSCTENRCNMLTILSCILIKGQGLASEDAKRLLDDILSNYNNLVRPVEKPSDHIKVYLGLKLSQIADIVSS